MSKLAQWLSRACSESGLPIDVAFRAMLPSGKEFEVIARLPGLGARNGMLIVRSYNEIAGHVKELTEAGYGYSVLDEPRTDEEFDLDSFQEMFRDWGWTGESRPRGR